jgi:hypothetical protein
MANAEVTEIEVAYPKADDLHLKLSVGACRLKVAPGDDERWVSGTYRHPPELPPKIEQQGGTVRVTQEHKEQWGPFSDPTPRFDLTLGKAKPYMLTLEAGASESRFDLGGLPISRLLIKQGAGKGDFDFSAPNPQAMRLLDLDAGAVSIEMRNLANANFAEMRVDGGVASYKFDFGGTLQRDAHVDIKAGMASVEVSVPVSTAAKITVESVMAGLDVGDGFMKKESAFWTPAALGGGTPVLMIHANVTMGGLRIRTT